MNCWFCGNELIWGADFDTEDYGYDGDGVVASLSCSNCGAMVECAYLVENDPRNYECDEDE